MPPEIIDYVSSQKAAEIFDKQLMQEATRQRILAIVGEYVDSVPFMEKVRKYAASEMDARLFTSAKFYVTTAIAAFIASMIGWGFGRIFK